MSSDRLSQIADLRVSLRSDLDVGSIGLPTSTMQQLENQMSRASTAIVHCLAEIGKSRRKISHLHRLLRLRKLRAQNFEPLDKDDWRERFDSLLSQLSLAVIDAKDSPEWVLEITKELDTVTMILGECSDLILESRADQAAFPFSVISVNAKMIVTVGELAKQPETRVVTQDEPFDQISVAMYVDGDDEAISEVINRVDRLVEAIGYGEPIDVHIERGSIFRRYFAAIRKGLSSRDVRERLIKAERAIELLAIETRQADVDHQLASAVSGLVASFNEVSSACVRIGSILFVKYNNGSQPVILVRTLSQVEISAFERYPEIQSDPVKVFQALALAITDT